MSFVLEGVDYSATPPGSAALKAADKHFAIRYLANDWRGIKPDEVRELTTGGVGIGVVYEENIRTWEGGFTVGVAHAQRAQSVLATLPLPGIMPIYFAVDDDATEADQVLIDAYLRGAASVIGRNRVGIYGGYHVVKRCFENGTATWFWQTTAWSGGFIHPALHLYQYGYSHVIGGTDCDDTRALQENYGQAEKFISAPPAPKPRPSIIYAHPQPIPPVGPKLLPYNHVMTVVTPYSPRANASGKGKITGAKLIEGDKIRAKWLMIADNGTNWLLTAGGSRHPMSAFMPIK